MTISEAKHIKIIDFLSSLNLFPVTIRNQNAWFSSPLRAERTASFIVNIIKNEWHDYGEGQGGDIIDLVKRIYIVNTSEALEILSKRNISPPFYRQFIDKVTQSGKLELTKVSELTSPALINYISRRGVSVSQAKRFTKEAHYSVNGNIYFAIAFKNDHGGYELRSTLKNYKFCVSPKDITTIKGKSQQRVNLFEGFFDFLSFLTYYKFEDPNFDCIILNSVSNLNKTISSLKRYPVVNLFLDNDNAGRSTGITIRNMHSDVRDFGSSIYPDFKDFNDFLIDSKKTMSFKSGMPQYIFELSKNSIHSLNVKK